MIVVVGGGISGLAAGHALQRAGAELVVLEAAPRPGGVVRSIEVEGRVLELGPQRARLTAPLRRMVAELGLEDELLTAADLPLYILTGGRLRRVPLSLREALTTDLLGWRDRLRALLEPLTPGLRADETAAEFFTRKLGRGTYERLVAPLYGGLYASDPADMPARHALAPTLAALGVRRSLLAAMIRGARAREGAPPCSFPRGLQTLTDALAASLGARLRVGTPARGLERRDGRLRVRLDRGELDADRVVLACPAGAAARLLREEAPAAADRLSRLRYNPLALVHLLSDADLRGLGYQVAFDAGLATRGVTWNHAMFGRDGLYTAFLGGAAAPEVPARSDDALKALAAREFREVTGHDARAIHVSRTSMPAWDRSWDALEGLELPRGVEVCASWAARPGITGRLVDAEALARRLSS